MNFCVISSDFKNDFNITPCTIRILCIFLVNFFFILFSIILCIFQNLWILKYILYLLSFNEFAKWSLVKLLITIYTHAYLSRRSRDKFVSRYNFVSKHEIHTNMLKIKIIRLIIYIFPSFSTLISWCIVHT